MMYKKFRKYLVILMAVAMVASFAVVPTSAAYTGNVDSNILLYGGMYWTHVEAWCESSDPHWCWAEVDYPDGRVYDYYYDSQMTAMAVAVASGPHLPTMQMAGQYPGFGAYGGQSK